MLPSFVAKAVPNSPRESFGSNVAGEKFHPGSFNEHLSTAESKRLHAKPPVKPKPNLPLISARSVSRSSRHEQIGSTSAKAAVKSFKAAVRPAAKASPAAVSAEDNLPQVCTPGDMAKVQPHHTTSSLLEALCKVNTGEAPPIENLSQPLPPTDPTVSTQAFLNPAAPTVPTPLVDSPAKPAEAPIRSARGITGESVQALQTWDALAAPQIQTAREPGETLPSGATADDESDQPESHPGEALDFSDLELRADLTGNQELSALPEPRILPAAPGQEAPTFDGIAVAKEMMSMKNTVEMDKVAGPAVKNLPGTERMLDLPAAQVISRVEEAREVRQELQHDSPVAHAAFTMTASSGAKLVAEDVSPIAAVSAVERVERAVLDGVAHLRQTGNESVSVVLKPDAGTELLLRVEMRDGALSAQLHFQRGDRSALDQNLDELQRRLAEQGVRLSRDDAGFGSGTQFAQSQRRSFVPENDLASDSFPATGTKKTSLHATSALRSVRGFETWA